MNAASPADLIVGVLCLGGSVFVLLGSFGILKLSDYFLRLHAATKASTLGVGAILLASAIHFSLGSGMPSLIELLTALLLFATVPVSAQMLARAALHLRPGAGPQDPGAGAGSSTAAGSGSSVPAPAPDAGNSPSGRSL